jgi:MFS family permease
MSGIIMGLGRWKCIMLMNLIVIVGCLLTLVDNVTVFIIGRGLYGVAAGGYSVFCPKYISEVSPTELKGPAGCLT